MSDLRKAAQQALEALENAGEAVYAHGGIAAVGSLNTAATALRAALAEPDSDYERGFVDGMNLQTKGSVGKTVNRMTQNPFGDDAERYARKLHEEREAYKAIFTEHKPQPEQEPVAWLWPHQLEELQHIHQLGIRAWSGKRYKPDGLVAVYTAPTPRKPLTVFEIDAIAEHLDKTTIGWATHEFAAAIEKAHGIGEQHE